jgi:hypothetical protein
MVQIMGRACSSERSRAPAPASWAEWLTFARGVPCKLAACFSAWWLFVGARAETEPSVSRPGHTQGTSSREHSTLLLTSARSPHSLRVPLQAQVSTVVETFARTKGTNVSCSRWNGFGQFQQLETEATLRCAWCSFLMCEKRGAGDLNPSCMPPKEGHPWRASLSALCYDNSALAFEIYGCTDLNLATIWAAAKERGVASGAKATTCVRPETELTIARWLRDVLLENSAP